MAFRGEELVVASRGVTATKRVVSEALERPAVFLSIANHNDTPVAARIFERLPDGVDPVDVAIGPDAHRDTWQVAADGLLEFSTVLGPAEERTTGYVVALHANRHDDLFGDPKVAAVLPIDEAAVGEHSDAVVWRDSEADDADGGFADWERLLAAPDRAAQEFASIVATITDSHTEVPAIEPERTGGDKTQLGSPNAGEDAKAGELSSDTTATEPADDPWGFHESASPGESGTAVSSSSVDASHDSHGVADSVRSPSAADGRPAGGPSDRAEGAAGARSERLDELEARVETVSETVAGLETETDTLRSEIDELADAVTEIQSIFRRLAQAPRESQEDTVGDDLDRAIRHVSLDDETASGETVEPIEFDGEAAVEAAEETADDGSTEAADADGGPSDSGGFVWNG